MCRVPAFSLCPVTLQFCPALYIISIIKLTAKHAHLTGIILLLDMQPISLDSDWHYFPTDVIVAAFGGSELEESSWGGLPRLSEYPRDIVGFSGVLNLRRTFDLEPITDVCVRYQLHLEHAPSDTEIYINGWYAGTTVLGQSFEIDVTDNVSLDDNLILLKLSHTGKLHGLTLHPVPCETLSQ